MTLRKIVGKMHLWLGLTSGLVVFIISVTGCLYAFKEEIQNLTQPYRFVKSESRPYLTPSALQKIAEKELPGKHAHSVVYDAPGAAAHVVFYHRRPNYFYKVYVNPYSGAVLKVKNVEEDFFRVVLMGHFYLWLPPKIGQPVAATATLIFVVMIVSGLILWWPRNKEGAKQRFSIKWNARWRRKNYDLHNVLGFYVFTLALVLALTGLVWGFKWFASSAYWVASGGIEMVKYYEPHSDTTAVRADASIPAVDKVWILLKAKHPSAQSYEIHFPDDAKAAIGASANPDASTYYKTDFIYYDQYTLKEVEVNHIYGRYHKANTGDMLMRMNYDIHVGAILGFPGKLLAFFISLITASLPVTGVLIWIGRKKKKKTEAKIQPINQKKLKPAIL